MKNKRYDRWKESLLKAGVKMYERNDSEIIKTRYDEYADRVRYFRHHHKVIG